jgi:carboxymethylenebutenolidase
MYDGMLAESTNIRGHGDDDIEAYFARPLGPGPYPAVVLIHHMPGYDRGSKELVRTFANYGYVTLCPNLFHRYAPGAKSGDAAAAARAAGGVPDEQCLGDVDGAARYLRNLPYTNGKVGVIGYCSGGRQAWLVACSLDVDAAVDCYGGRVVAGGDELSAAHPVAPIDLTPQMRCPILGLFGNEDRSPSPEHVDRMEAELQAHGKTYEFHRYDGAGHAFFSVDRPSYHLEAAKDGWKRIWAFYGQHLATD